MDRPVLKHGPVCAETIPEKKQEPVWLQNCLYHMEKDARIVNPFDWITEDDEVGIRVKSSSNTFPKAEELSSNAITSEKIEEDEEAIWF